MMFDALPAGVFDPSTFLRDCRCSDTFICDRHFDWMMACLDGHEEWVDFEGLAPLALPPDAVGIAPQETAP